MADSRLVAGLAGFELQPGWFDLLAGPSTRRQALPAEPTQLIQATMLSSVGMTKRLDRMAAAGLVERHPDPSDRQGILSSGPSPDLQDLLDLATSCDIDPRVRTITVGARTESPLVLYVRERADLALALTGARKALQHWCILPSATLTRLLDEHRLRVDAGDSPVDLRRILDPGDPQDWIWRHCTGRAR